MFGQHIWEGSTMYCSTVPWVGIRIGTRGRVKVLRLGL